LILIARENDAHFEKSKRLLLNLLEVKSLDEIKLVVQEAFRNDQNIDFSSIVLFGEADDYPASDVTVMPEEQAKQLLGSLLENNQAKCGRFSAEQAQCLFGGDAEQVGSAAVIPIDNGRLLGVFCLASKDEQHFNSSMGSLFLSYISDFISRILPNLLESARSRPLNESVPSLLE